ncbi:MAG: NAD(P)/FAD-dependent oxidoreductase [Spirochaetia bacterium]
MSGSSMYGNNHTYDVSIIGGGVVGSAIARELSRYKLRCALIEKEPDVAEGISKANSGVLHAGFNVPPGSLKARFNIEGLSYFPDLADRLEVSTERCKKIVVAKTDGERNKLEELLEQGRTNGSTGLSIIGKSRISEVAPGVEGKWALYSESTGIINPFLFTLALAENAAINGVDFFLGTELSGITREHGPSGGFTLITSGGRRIYSRTVINSAGMGSDRIARMVEPDFPEKIYPCRGEYHIIDKEYSATLNTAVYPVPVKDGRSLGVHLTPTTNGNILFGPSAEYINSPEDTSTTQETMEKLLNEAFELLPRLRGAGVIKSYAGIRPKLFTPQSGIHFKDFYIKESPHAPGFLNLVGIESPGLTASPAIASYVVEQFVASHLSLRRKENFISTRKGIPRTAHLSREENNKLYLDDPEFAEILCRCERISKGEIKRAIENPLGVRTLNGIKKRTYSMMGRCQSGFCLPRIARILTDEYGISPGEIKKSGDGSEIATGWME